MSVYGKTEGIITPETVPAPANAYGRSKLEAEEGLLSLADDSFTVTILRPPMIYGPGCKGNYRSLEKLAWILPLCPTYQNQRSALSVEGLNAFVLQLLQTCSGGIFCPQDPQYLNTCREIRAIAERNGRHLPSCALLNFGPALLRLCTEAGKKAFGNLTYSGFDDIKR